MAVLGLLLQPARRRTPARFGQGDRPLRQGPGEHVRGAQPGAPGLGLRPRRPARSDPESIVDYRLKLDEAITISHRALPSTSRSRQFGGAVARRAAAATASRSSAPRCSTCLRRQHRWQTDALLLLRNRIMPEAREACRCRKRCRAESRRTSTAGGHRRAVPGDAAADLDAVRARGRGQLLHRADCHPSGRGAGERAARPAGARCADTAPTCSACRRS